MTDPAALAHSLPSAARQLIQSFQRAHPEAELRLWERDGESWRCLFPSNGGATGNDPAANGAPAPGDDGAGWLEVAGTAPAEVRLQWCSPAVRGEEAGFLAEALSHVLRYEKETRSAARELADRYEEIDLLYSISEILGSVLPMPSASSRILGQVADLLSARRASLWVYDPGTDRLHLAAAVGERTMSGPIAIDDPRSATALVFRERRQLNLEQGSILDLETDHETRPRGREAFLSVPINYTPPEGETRTVGVITVVGGAGQKHFSAGDSRLLASIASQVGAALENQRLVQESLRQERIGRELELAHDLQLKLLPDPALFQESADVAARCVPADSVGGDFYHLFRLSGDRLGVMIGDVSSHGFPAALIMALTMSAVAIYAQETGPPGELLRQIHRALAGELERTEMYLSLFYGVVDRRAGRLTYTNAGHPHAFRVGADGTAHRLGATNPPLGMLPIERYGEGEVEWTSEDLLVLFTDGLSDALASDGLKSGESRLLGAVGRLNTRPAAEILAELFSLVREGRSDIPPDDRTAILVRT